MNKLVYGVGVNDLGYKVHVREDVTENGGKRIRKTVFLCKYYAVWRDMLTRCYNKKYLERNPSYIGTIVCSEWLSATAFKNGWGSNTGRIKASTKTLLFPEANSIPLKHVLLC
jgi:hypothetical protein